MGVDKDTEVALKEEVTEGLKDAAQEGVKDEVKEDKKDEIEDTADLKTKAEADADAATSSHTLMPDAPTAHAAAISLATPSLDSKPQNSALHEAPAEDTAPDDAVPQDSSSKAAPQQPDPQEAAATTEAVAEKTYALPTPAPKAVVTVDEIDEVPDPDEDDLDDLDDMLEEFSAVKLDQTKPPGAAAAGSSKPEAPKGSASGKQPEVEDAFSEDEFARQLQAGMADLLGELEQSPDMQAQFEDIFKHIAAAEGAGDAPPPSTSKGPSSQAPPEDASFQDTIKRTMERMQASGDQATAAAASGSADDFMSEMLKQLSSGDLGDLGGDGSEEEFSKMLMGMMEQLTNKEILYEPMKELDEKFPEWLIKNRDSTPKDDLKRYEEQQSIVREIVAKFEEKTYSDSNAADREFIVDKMQKMQAAGSPPSDLVGDMQSAQDALNPGDEACNPQ
ncbi:peroxisomal biogenesis factor 19 [Fusarium coicis]|nr:peroxisomal biogenesis factor 19 [Fusarium coicis]